MGGAWIRRLLAWVAVWLLLWPAAASAQAPLSPSAGTAVSGGVPAVSTAPAAAGTAAPAPGTDPPATPVYVFGPDPIAPAGSLRGDYTSVTVALGVYDAAGAPQPGATVYLSFQPGTPNGPNQASATANGQQLGATPSPVVADAQGQVRIAYSLGDDIYYGLPETGVDAITAQNAPADPAVVARDSYSYSVPIPVGGQLVWSRTPLAPAGSLAQGSAPVTVTVTAEDPSGRPLAGAAVYLSLQQGNTNGQGSNASATGATGSNGLNGSPQLFVANGQGQVAVTYQVATCCGLPAAGSDSLVAQNAAATSTVTASDSYSYSTPVPTGGQFVWSQAPIAAAGSLAQGSAPVTLTVTAEDPSGRPLPGADVYLSLQQGNDNGAGSTASATGAHGASGLSGSPQLFVANGQGQVTVNYQVATCCGLPSAGTDVLVAQNAAKASEVAVTGSDSYSYSTPVPAGGAFVFSASPLAPSGSLAQGSAPVTVTVTAEDPSGRPLPGADVYLSLQQGNDNGAGSTASATGAHGGNGLNGSPQLFVANAQGQVTVSYQVATCCGLPSAGTDLIVAQNAASGPSVSASDGYSYSTLIPGAGRLVFSRSPIAGPGSLAQGSAPVALTVTAEDSSGQPLPGAAVYLSLQQGNGNGAGSTAGATGATGGNGLNGSPQLFVANGQGQVAVTYQVATCCGLPTAGTDVLVAQNAATGPTVSATDSYSYAVPVPTGGQFVFGPAPIAPAGSLAQGSAPVTVTVTAEDPSGRPLPGADVYLSLQQGNGNGAGSTAGATGATGGNGLTATPQLFVANGQGQVAVTYQVATCCGLPTAGTDVLVAQNAVIAPTVSASDAYSYGVPLPGTGSIAFSLRPLAPAGSLAQGSAPVTVTVTAKDPSGRPLPGADVYLSLQQGNDNGAGSTAGATGATGGNGLSGTPQLFVANGQGQVAVTYQVATCCGLPTAGTDVLVAQNAATGPTVSATDSYSYAVPVPTGGQFVFGPDPIAAAGSLAQGSAPATVTVTAEDPSGRPLPGADVYLSLQQGNDNGAGSTASATGATGSNGLTGTPQLFVANGQGQVTVSYQVATCCGLPTAGGDLLVAQNAGSAPSVQAADSYSYASTGTTPERFAWTPNPIALPGGLTAGQSAQLTLTATDAATGGPLGGATVYLSLQATAGGGSATVGTTALSATAQPVTTDAQGQIQVTYTAPATLPLSGADVLVAQDAATNPAVLAQDRYAFSSSLPSGAQLVWNPSPLAPAGTLAPGQAVTATVTAEDPNGNPLPGALIYLSLQGASGGGSAGVGGTPLGATPAPFKADGAGVVTVRYTAPLNLPPSGTDVLAAASAASDPAASAADRYDFSAGLLPAGGSYAFAPSPLAPAGALAPGQAVTVALTVYGAAGTALPYGLVYLSFQPADGGGAASADGVPLGSTPLPFVADSTGQLAVTYTAPTGAPPSGTDVLTAQNAAAAPTVSATDAYTFSNLVATAGGSYAFGPAPVAPAGSLGPGQTVTVALAVYDAGGQPLPQGLVYLALDRAAGGGSASVDGVALTAAPQPFLAGPTGRMAITYITPAALPAVGTDVLIAQNAAAAPTVMQTDLYAFSALAPQGGAISLTPDPLAAQRSLAPGESVTVTAAVYDAAGSLLPRAQVWLSFTPAAGGGSANVAGTPLSPVPTAFLADATGHLAVTYTAPVSPPASGVDVISAQNGPVEPTVVTTDSYTFGVAVPAGSVFAFAPQPVASAGSLAPGESRTVTLTVYDPDGRPLGGGLAYLSFVPAPGGGSAAVGGEPLGATPTRFVADAAGQIVVTYTAPPSPPDGGTDTLTVQNAAADPGVTLSDTYSFAEPVPADGQLAFAPAPVAAAGSLVPGAAVDLQLVARGASGAPLPYAAVYVAFQGSGSAYVGSAALDASPALFLTGPAGTLAVRYVASAVPLTGGTDEILAQNAAAGAELTAVDPYTYGGLAVLTTALPAGRPGQPYSQTLTAFGGVPPYTWSVAQGALPPGLSLSPEGAIAGTPSAAASASFTVRVTDAAGASAEQAFTIAVGAPDLLSVTPAGGAVGAPIALAGSGFGTVAGTVYFSQDAVPFAAPLASAGWSDTAIAALVPAGLAPGSAAVSVYSATTGLASASLPFTVVPALAVTTTGLPEATVGSPYQATLAAFGGQPPYDWSLTAGALPAGLVLDTVSGTVSGTPASPGTADFTARVTDALGETADAALSLTVQPARFTFTPSPIAPAGSLAAGETVPLTLHAAAGETVYLSFAGPGAVVAGAAPLGATPAAFTAGPDGTLGLTYSAPGTLPPGGTATITVQDAATQPAAVGTDTYSFAPPPAVAAVTPSSGPAAGGTPVSITGSGFTGATAVDFGPGDPARFQVESAGSIEATAPPGAGTVDVTVTAPAGTSQATAADRFTYLTFGTAAALRFIAQPPAWVAVGPAGSTPFSVAVAVYDAAGNLVATSADEIAVAVAPAGTTQPIAGLGGTTEVRAVDGVATFSALTLSPALAGGTYQFVAFDRTHPAVAPATAAASEVLASTLLFSSTAGEGAAWGPTLPSPGAGDDSIYAQPFTFAGVQFVVDYAAGDHLVLSGDPFGQQPFCVDGTWTLALNGPVSRQASGSGCQGPVDLASLGLPSGTYGAQISLTAPAAGNRYGTGDISLAAVGASDFWMEPLVTPLQPLEVQVDQTAPIPAGSSGTLPLLITSTPEPVQGVHSEATWDASALAVTMTPPPGGGGHQGGLVVPGHTGLVMFPGGPLAGQIGQALMELDVQCIEPGTWPISFAGNWWSPTTTQPFGALVTVECSAPVPGPAATSGVSVSPTDGSLDVTVTGTGLAAAARAALMSPAGVAVASSSDFPTRLPDVLTVHFPGAPAGLDTVTVFDAAGGVIASTPQSIALPPAVPVFRVGEVDLLPQVPGYAITHLWRVQDVGPVDGVAILAFVFPGYIAPEPVLDTASLPTQSRLLAHGFDPELGDWVEFVAIPVAAGTSVDVPWTLTLPPSAVFGPGAPVPSGAPVPQFAQVRGELTAAEWSAVQAEGDVAIAQAGATSGNADLAGALAELNGSDPGQLAAYGQALAAVDPTLASYLFSTGRIQQWIGVLPSLQAEAGPP